MKKTAFTGLLLCIWSICLCQTSESLTQVSTEFLNTLSQEQLKEVSFDFEDAKRTDWTKTSP